MSAARPSQALPPNPLSISTWFSHRPRICAKPHHLYVLGAGATELLRHLAFRDALRSDNGLRDTYAALKRSLAVEYRNDRKSYTEGKSAFIKSIIGSSSLAAVTSD
jgi:GrpB-like predicted nucleotidyltransferase (UPF0157 family)